MSNRNQFYCSFYSSLIASGDSLIQLLHMYTCEHAVEKTAGRHWEQHHLWQWKQKSHVDLFFLSIFFSFEHSWQTSLALFALFMNINSFLRAASSSSFLFLLSLSTLDRWVSIFFWSFSLSSFCIISIDSFEVMHAPDGPTTLALFLGTTLMLLLLLLTVQANIGSSGYICIKWGLYWIDMGIHAWKTHITCIYQLASTLVYFI